MGYVSRCHLVDVQIKETLLPRFMKRIKARNPDGSDDVSYFLNSIILVEDRFLQFASRGDDTDGYVPDEEDGSVPTRDSKWYEDIKVAKLLRTYCQAGGRIVFHSLEADGEAWGWEFDGRGRMREIALVSVGNWMSAKTTRQSPKPRKSQRR